LGGRLGKNEDERRNVLFPAGVGEVFGVHGAHGTHADQSNCRLLVKGVTRSDVDGNGHDGKNKREGCDAAGLD